MNNVIHVACVAALALAVGCKNADQPAPATKPADPVAPQPAPTPAPAPAPAPAPTAAPAPAAQCCCVTQPIEEEEFAIVASTACTSASTEGTCTDMDECTKRLAQVKPPGACVAIPEPVGNLNAKDDFDLDGDGSMDRIVQSSEECTADDCDHAIYLRRGACGHFLGTVSMGWSDEPELFLTRGKHGLFGLSVKEVEGGLSDYVFDGTKYKRGKHNRQGP